MPARLRPSSFVIHPAALCVFMRLIYLCALLHTPRVCVIALERRGCEQNQASYNVFQLDAFVNTTQIADLKQFPKVTTAIDAITVSERTMLSLTQTIQNILENMLHTSSFNLTTYRVSIGAPTPEKDLATFIDQMQRVALQVSDVWGPLDEPRCYLTFLL